MSGIIKPMRPNFSLLDVSGKVPLSFSNELTTIEVLASLQKMLENSCDYVEKIEDYTNNYTDSEIAKVVTQIKETLSTAKEYTDEKYWKLFSALNEKDGETNSKVDALTETLENYYIALKKVDETLKAEIDKIKADFKNNKFAVISPVSGKVVPLQDALYQIYNTMRDGYTIAEIEIKKLTATVVDALNAKINTLERNVKSVF